MLADLQRQIEEDNDEGLEDPRYKLRLVDSHPASQTVPAPHRARQQINIVSAMLVGETETVKTEQNNAKDRHWEPGKPRLQPQFLVVLDCRGLYPDSLFVRLQFRRSSIESVRGTVLWQGRGSRVSEEAVTLGSSALEISQWRGAGPFVCISSLSTD